MSNQISRRFVLLTAALAPGAILAQDNLLDRGRSLLNQVPNSGAPPAANPSSGSGASLSQSEIGFGLKDALKVAAQRVVGQVGKTDGFNGDSTIRIPLPGALQKIQGSLKAAGAGGLLDDLQTKMNRAAEAAAPKALDIFIDAATRMSFSDARSILTGPADAATQYFRRTTAESLTASFRPIIDSALSQVGAVSLFKSVQSKAGAIPFAGQEAQSFDLTSYTLGKALDGLFHYLASEEASIRSNPVARTTDLLKKVFG